ncbi:pyridoxal-phosphate dependent enzyme [Pseudarthrobacter sp. NamB4]|uniref:pyridoxal-phosphate dependent enzyme n=1 Tax=Pseudarthrobacter sp. NamB4 TaxID=2576837 RepID=UPI0010FD4CA5|nr:pyridoxal-phosphate dependent enzyme [Pseudarthrobacter sp. NamB4]TLM72235.1 pyridoxal-phosphate dependent enzyme [Pseudarthrobacter sp. NamB4]
MKTVCQSCGTAFAGTSGHCVACGGVCLRTDPWSAPPESAPSHTPLVRSRIPGLEGTWLKVEGANPSGSFKDRVMDVLVREAVAAGAPGAVVASSGNAAVAAATHCARAHLPLLVLVPEQVPAPILAMVQLRGATILRAGEGPAAVHHLARLVSEKYGVPNLASTFGASGCEWACRSIGHEISVQLKDREVTTLAASISVGPVLLGSARGLTESGRPFPRMVAGQAAGCAPIAKAFFEGRQEVQPWEGPVLTRATSIADRLNGYATEATFFLNRVRASNGTMSAADDALLRDIRMDLARYDGLDVELSSCAAVAALIASRLGGEESVCILTGAGVKETLAGWEPTPPGAVDEFFRSVLNDPAGAQEVDQWIHEYQL